MCIYSISMEGQIHIADDDFIATSAEYFLRVLHLGRSISTLDRQSVLSGVSFGQALHLELELTLRLQEEKHRTDAPIFNVVSLDLKYTRLVLHLFL